MKVIDVYRRVERRELTPEQAADRLRRAREVRSALNWNRAGMIWNAALAAIWLHEGHYVLFAAQALAAAVGIAAAYLLIQSVP